MTFAFLCSTIDTDKRKGVKHMTKSEQSKWSNIIQRMVESNYESMSNKTKENLFGVSNAIFSDKENI